MVRTQSPSNEHQEAGDLQDLVASLDFPSIESREDRSAITVASLPDLLPADHLAAWEALTLINAADQGVTATLNENKKTLNKKTLNEIKDTPNENEKTLNEIESPEAFASN